MAANDIRFYASEDGSQRLKYAPLASGASFREGEPVVFSSGGLTEASSDPSAVFGIATVPASATAVSSFVKFSRAAGTAIQVYGTTGDLQFQCTNFATDGAGTSATPTQGNAIGQLAGFIDDGTNWFIDTGAANLLVTIDDVLDSRGNSITDPTVLVGSGATVVFRFV